MSRALSFAKGEYIYSPVDDLESFFWVALWSVLFNAKSGEAWEAEEQAREELLNGNKEAAMTIFSLLIQSMEPNSVTRCFRHFIQAWWRKVRDKNVQWADEVLDHCPPDAGKKYFLPHFHLFALQGVLDVLEVLEQHWDCKIRWESWTGQASTK